MPKCYIGTSGYIQQKHFYPNDVIGKKKFPYYTTQFNSVEINSSFYRTPSLKTIQEWHYAAPKDFIFTFKVLRYTLQYNPFNTVSFNEWYDHLALFENQSHVLLFQYPGSKHFDLDYLQDLLEKLPKTFRFAFEFRHSSWFIEETYKLLRKYNAAIVLNDSPRTLLGRTWPLEDIDTADFTYIRFHGSLAMYASGYLKPELEGYAKIIKAKLKKGNDVFCYFNNDIFGHAIKNARELKELI